MADDATTLTASAVATVLVSTAAVASSYGAALALPAALVATSLFALLLADGVVHISVAAPAAFVAVFFLFALLLADIVVHISVAALAAFVAVFLSALFLTDTVVHVSVAATAPVAALFVTVASFALAFLPFLVALAPTPSPFAVLAPTPPLFAVVALTPSLFAGVAPTPFLFAVLALASAPPLLAVVPFSAGTGIVKAVDGNAAVVTILDVSICCRLLLMMLALLSLVLQQCFICFLKSKSYNEVFPDPDSIVHILFLFKIQKHRNTV